MRRLALIGSRKDATSEAGFGRFNFCLNFTSFRFLKNPSFCRELFDERILRNQSWQRARGGGNCQLTGLACSRLAAGLGRGSRPIRSVERAVRAQKKSWLRSWGARWLLIFLTPAVRCLSLRLRCDAQSNETMKLELFGR